MTFLLIQLGIYWGCIKAMEWKLPFYVAALLYVFIYTGFMWILSSAYSGDFQSFSIRILALQAVIAVPVFYLFDRFSDTDSIAAPASVFIIGFVLLVISR